MNDRFKFRVWIESQKRIITDVTGFVIDTNKEKIRVFRMNTKMPDGMSSELFMLANVIIEQCTGVKDKNGKLIYEGDIVRHDPAYSDLPYENLKVMWDEENAEFCFFCSQEMFAGQFAEEYEVIGNIHENHELLDS